MSLLIIKHLKVLYKTVNVSKRSNPSEMRTDRVQKICL